MWMSVHTPAVPWGGRRACRCASISIRAAEPRARARGARRALPHPAPHLWRWRRRATRQAHRAPAAHSTTSRVDRPLVLNAGAFRLLTAPVHPNPRREGNVRCPAPRVGGGLERATPRLQGCTGHLCQRSSVVSSRAHGREGTRVAAACGSRRARRLGLPGAAPLCTVRLHERAGRGRYNVLSWWQGTLRLSSLVKRAVSHVLRRRGAHRHTAGTTERQDIYPHGRTAAR